MFLRGNYTGHRTFHIENGKNNLYTEHRKEVVQVAIMKVTLDGWEVVITYFLLCVWAFGFTLLCLKVISCRGGTAVSENQQVFPAAAGNHDNINYNFRHEVSQISNLSGVQNV